LLARNPGAANGCPAEGLRKICDLGKEKDRGRGRWPNANPRGECDVNAATELEPTGEKKGDAIKCKKKTQAVGIPDNKQKNARGQNQANTTSGKGGSQCEKLWK